MTDPYAQNSTLTQLCGNSPKPLIIAAFLSRGINDELTTNDLTDLTGLHRSTIYRHIDDLIDLGVIRKTRTVGNAPLYTLKDNSVTKEIAQLEWELIDEVVDEE